MAEGGFHRGGSALTIAGWRFRFESLVEVSSEYYHTELEAHIPDEQQQRDPHRPSFCAFVVDVDVRDSKVGARLAARPAELAGNCHAMDSPCRATQRT